MWRSSSPRATKSANASCPTTSEPPSSTVLHPHRPPPPQPPPPPRLARAQPPRQPRGREHPAEPHAWGQPLAGRRDVRDVLGRETLQRADRDPVVAVLGVVV